MNPRFWQTLADLGRPRPEGRFWQSPALAAHRMTLADLADLSGAPRRKRLSRDDDLLIKLGDLLARDPADKGSPRSATPSKKAAKGRLRWQTYENHRSAKVCQVCQRAGGTDHGKGAYPQGSRGAGLDARGALEGLRNVSRGPRKGCRSRIRDLDVVRILARCLGRTKRHYRVLRWSAPGGGRAPRRGLREAGTRPADRGTWRRSLMIVFVPAISLSLAMARG